MPQIHVDIGYHNLVALLKTCTEQKDLRQGSRIHANIVESRLLEKNCYIASAMINMYAKCGAFEKARQVLHELPVRHVVSWNALIAGYVQQGNAQEALNCINQMQREGISPDAVTFTCGLRACGDIKAADEGERIHEDIVKQKLLENDIVLGTALVDMYARCGALKKAHQVLHELPTRNVISWTALMAGYIQQEKAEEALSCIDQLKGEGLSPDAVTFACALQACGSVRTLERGERICEEIVNRQLLPDDTILACLLVDMYAKCGVLEKARQMLHEFSVQDIVSWNALLAGYIQQGKGEEVLSCIDQMWDKGLLPDAVTYVCALGACGIIGAVDKGEQIHKEIVKEQLIENGLLGNALVDMYAKCGAFEKAQQVLHELPVRDVVSWTALISGYMQQGKSKEVLLCFEQMQQEGISPNSITFLCVLTACSHSGLLGKGQIYFGNMGTEYGITPGIKHNWCMVDLFGRAGEFDKALTVIASMPSCEDRSRWRTLLGASWKWKNVEIGRLAFERSVHMDKCEATAYVIMSNIYAASGMHDIED